MLPGLEMGVTLHFLVPSASDVMAVHSIQLDTDTDAVCRKQPQSTAKTYQAETIHHITGKVLTHETCRMSLYSILEQDCGGKKFN